MLICLLGDAARHGRDGEGVLHVAEGGVGLGRLGEELWVQVNVVIALELVAELFAQLGEKARVDQNLGAGINACFSLRKS